MVAVKHFDRNDFPVKNIDVDHTILSILQGDGLVSRPPGSVRLRCGVERCTEGIATPAAIDDAEGWHLCREGRLPGSSEQVTELTREFWERGGEKRCLLVHKTRR